MTIERKILEDLIDKYPFIIQVSFNRDKFKSTGAPDNKFFDMGVSGNSDTNRIVNQMITKALNHIKLSEQKDLNEQQVEVLRNHFKSLGFKETTDWHADYVLSVKAESFEQILNIIEKTYNLSIPQPIKKFKDLYD